MKTHLKLMHVIIDMIIDIYMLCKSSSKEVFGYFILNSKLCITKRSDPDTLKVYICIKKRFPLNMSYCFKFWNALMISEIHPHSIKFPPSRNLNYPFLFCLYSLYQSQSPFFYPFSLYSIFRCFVFHVSLYPLFPSRPPL